MMGYQQSVEQSQVDGQMDGASERDKKRWRDQGEKNPYKGRKAPRVTSLTKHLNKG